MSLIILLALIRLVVVVISLAPVILLTSMSSTLFFYFALDAFQAPHSRRETNDSFNDETFGSLECTSEDRAEEERKRRGNCSFSEDILSCCICSH